MAGPQEEVNHQISNTPEEQSLALKEFLSSINSARRQTSMYGEDHPNSQAALAHVAQCTEELASSYERATCVFTHEAVIINQHYYAASRDSLDMCERLRARGAMAVTLVGVPPIEQVRELLAFLNEEPREVRLQDGPSAYLRKRGVSRIVLTEAIYLAGESPEDQETEADRWDGVDEDVVVAAVIDWLMKQDQPDDLVAPKLPITRILSDPDSAAKLIREAVTKLHASRRDMSQGECITEALNDLKSVADDTPGEWDRATPQIRKAIAKLPENMRPTTTGFSAGRMAGQIDDTSAPLASIEEAESLVHTVLQQMIAAQDSSSFPSPRVFDHFFGTRAPGLLASWKKELQPTSVLESSGRTLDVLMNWETNAGEHGRIVQALAALIPRAIEVNDVNGALEFTERLLNGALQDTDLGWRKANVRGALEALEKETVLTLAKSLIGMRRARSEEAVIALLTVMPRLALGLTDVIGTREGENITSVIKSALLECGQAAQPTLARMLRQAPGEARRVALEVLIETRRAWAAEEIIRTIKDNDEDFAIMALGMLPKVRMPIVTEACIDLLSHEAASIRCAALRTLGQLRDTSVTTHIAKIAVKTGLFSSRVDEQIAAVEALGLIGDSEAIQCLKSISKRRMLFGRSRYESVRRSAERVLKQFDDSTTRDQSKAA